MLGGFRGFNQSRWRWAIALISMVLSAGLIVVGLGGVHPEVASDPHAVSNPSMGTMGAALAQSGRDLPTPVQLELPPSLARVSYNEREGDYFDEIDALGPQGSYLQWPFYPIPVYIQDDNDQWFTFVEQAVQDWSEYVPMKVVDDPDQAIIGISIERVPRMAGISGAARPEFLFASDGSFQQHVTIIIGEFQGLAEVTGVTRHEIGHALGLWGHSANLRDLMYGGNHAARTGGARALRVPQIRPRDLNTIQRVYEQPTLVGQIFPEEIRQLLR